MGVWGLLWTASLSSAPKMCPPLTHGPGDRLSRIQPSLGNQSQVTRVPASSWGKISEPLSEW